jgi:hypothetical protein
LVKELLSKLALVAVNWVGYDIYLETGAAATRLVVI